MRVLHVYSGNLYGGIEAILVSLVRHRAESALSHEFALCFDGRLRRELGALGAVVHDLGPVRASRPRSVGRARRALRSLLAPARFDRVICHAPWSHALFAGVVRRAGVPLVFWVHDAIAGRHWTERWARRLPPDLAICNSRYTASTLPALYSNVQASVVYAPLDLARSPMPVVERNAFRAALDTAGDATVIVQTSRLEAWKGHEVAIEALARLRDVPGWVWWVAGGAQRPEEHAHADRLRASADRLGIADRIRWLGERDDVPRLLGAADIHCQPNLGAEPFGVAYVEALAAGLPVVASRAGGATEIVDDTCGVLVAPGDVPGLAAVLGRLIADPAWRTTLASGACARARHLSDPGPQLRRLEDSLASIAAAGATV